MIRSAPGADPLLRFDPMQAQSGRIHDVLLGAGKDAYSVDLAAGQELIDQVPDFRITARATRAWLLRAVECLATEHGVRQFVELGAGYPCPPNVHEIVAASAPDARTLYVDVDPVVAAHGRVFLATEHTHFLQANIADTDTVITEIRAVMNQGKPIAICISFVAEFLPNPAAVIEAITGALPCGSYMVLSHITGDLAPEVAKRATDVYTQFRVRFRPRSQQEIAALFAGYDLLDPGLVAPHRWRPSAALDRFGKGSIEWCASEDADLCCYAGIALRR